MHDNTASKTLSENLSSLQNIQEELHDIQDVKLNAIYTALKPNHFIKKISKRNEPVESTLCVKIKDKNIRQVQFGLCVDVGCDVFYEYLYNKEICSINLNFHLKNLSNEHNSAYFVHNIDTQSPLTSFITKDNQLNSINLTQNIKLLQEEIRQNNKISFFIPMFQSYDNYDEFYNAIHNVMLKINYLE